MSMTLVLLSQLKLSSQVAPVANIKFSELLEGPDLTLMQFSWMPGVTKVKRGLHIHDRPVPADGNCTETGIHFDRKSRSNHGSFNSTVRHLGDLGNTHMRDFAIVFNTPFQEIVSNLNLLSVVMHEKEDDLGMGGTKESLETGSAGGRVACSNINKKLCFPWHMCA